MNNNVTKLCAAEGPFKMDRYEAAKFVEDHEHDIFRLLRGKYEDKLDAISQVKMKVLEIAIENDDVLRFTKGQLKKARTTVQWVSLFASHARARLGIVQSQRSAWYDKDIMSEFGLRADYDEVEDMSTEEAAFVSGMERAEDEMMPESNEAVVPDVPDEEAAEHEPQKPSALAKWRAEKRKKRTRILGAIDYGQHLHSVPKTHSIDRKWIREQVRAEVKRIAKEAGFSDRDILVYCLGVFKGYTAKEVLAKIPSACSTSNVDKIKSLIKTAIEEAAHKPGSKLAFLYAA